VAALVAAMWVLLGLEVVAVVVDYYTVQQPYQLE
jgi:hypothetical protein